MNIKNPASPAKNTATNSRRPTPAEPHKPCLIDSELAMLQFGKEYAKNLTLPSILVLLGDVGAGKTTFTRGLATGLGVTEPITSPSFTISKRYSFTHHGQPAELIHYDFYRLSDPGIMASDLMETLLTPNTVTVIEWGQDVAALLPPTSTYLQITLQPDGSRLVTQVTHPHLSEPAA